MHVIFYSTAVSKMINYIICKLKGVYFAIVLVDKSDFFERGAKEIEIREVFDNDRRAKGVSLKYSN